MMPGLHSRRRAAPLVLGLLLLSGPAVAAEKDPGPARDKRLELELDVGMSIPQDSSNTSTGVETVGSVSWKVSRYVGLGLFVDWARRPWDAANGQKAHVDASYYGPELRIMIPNSTILVPQASVGIGPGDLSPSLSSTNSRLLPSAGVRLVAGAGIRMTPWLRFVVLGGISTVTTGSEAWSAADGRTSSGQDPKIPFDDGVDWTLTGGVCVGVL
jgi:hypothetical protein